jgi:signal peptidase II
MVVTILFDQWLKAWVRGNLNPGQSWSGGPWHGVFELTLTFNRGIAFGMFQGAALLMTPVAIIIAALAIRSIYKNPQETRWGAVALGLLASGALGNLFDRIVFREQGVTDMFLLRLANITGGRLNDFPVFNVADSCISVAMVMLLISWSKQPAAEKQEPLTVQEPKLEDSSL